VKGQNRWVVGLAAGMGFVSFAATSGLFVLASRFVERLSLPHITLDELQFTFKLPASLPEAPLHLCRAITFRTADGKVLRGLWSGPFWLYPGMSYFLAKCADCLVLQEFWLSWNSERSAA
jgi:hypothetical protein